MNKESCLKKLLFLLISVVLISPAKGQTTTETYTGKLIVGKSNSAIIYYGEQSGDLAAFCFTNNSAVGRAALSKCRNGRMCRFTGQISLTSGACGTAHDWAKRLELGGFSQTATIVSLKSVKIIGRRK
jgi:hypothetical protein